MVVWLITGIITVIGAISYGELASMMPSVGGQYVYLREAYHPLIGFLFGWTTFLVIQCGSIAAVAVAFAKFSGVLIPWISDKNILLQIGPLKYQQYNGGCNCNDSISYMAEYQGNSYRKNCSEYFHLNKSNCTFRIYPDRISCNKRDNIMADKQGSFLAGRQNRRGNQIIPLAGFALVAAVGTALVGSLVFI